MSPMLERAIATPDGFTLGVTVGRALGVPLERDLKNWRSSRAMEGFLPDEREWFGTLLGPRTLIDVVRSLHPDAQGPYSWWSWLAGRFGADVGWRIDYQLASPGLARAAVAGGTDREAHSSVRLSDHAPVVVDYDA